MFLQEGGRLEESKYNKTQNRFSAGCDIFFLYFKILNQNVDPTSCASSTLYLLCTVFYRCYGNNLNRGWTEKSISSFHIDQRGLIAVRGMFLYFYI